MEEMVHTTFMLFDSKVSAHIVEGLDPFGNDNLVNHANYVHCWSYYAFIEQRVDLLSARSKACNGDTKFEVRMWRSSIDVEFRDGVRCFKL